MLTAVLLLATAAPAPVHRDQDGISGSWHMKWSWYHSYGLRLNQDGTCSAKYDDGDSWSGTYTWNKDTMMLRVTRPNYPWQDQWWITLDKNMKGEVHVSWKGFEQIKSYGGLSSPHKPSSPRE